ncbi:hypothetical protein NZK33_13465 [Cyanobium sp. FGCU-6]|nr:hypothetical protein [Cyanobium sp. FGCU6]
MDFFALNEEGRTALIRTALEQSRSFRLTGTGPDGAEGTITCDLDHSDVVARLWKEAVLPHTAGQLIDLLFCSGENGQLADPAAGGRWGALSVGTAQGLAQLAATHLGASRPEAALLGELCVGLEAGSIWAVFRDGDGEVCATPVQGEGVFAAAAL